MTRRVDLRSDTVTQPTPAMRQAMMSAALGDDVFADDPTVNLLQVTLAKKLGFEQALFFPSGTQSNLAAILSHCQRGDEYIVGQMAHTYRWEAGGAAVLGSVQPQPLEQAANGQMDLAKIESSIKPDDAHFAMTKLLTLENTWAGQLLDHQYVLDATSIAKKHQLKCHLDGARLFNGAVKQSIIDSSSVWEAASKMVAPFDSVSVCFSKGLGAPVGSVLCASAELIQKAKRIRKMAGGAMRQSGFLAAAALYALDHHIERLQQDHDLASRLYAGLQNIKALDIGPPQTNMIFLAAKPGFEEQFKGFTAFLNQNGILTTGSYQLRFVTHLDVNQDDIDYVIEKTNAYFSN